MSTLSGTLAEARAHKESADYEAALELYRRIIAEAPQDYEDLPTAHVEMGLVLGFMGEFDDSLAVLQESTQLWPTSAYAYLNLGKTLLMLGQYDEARPALEKTMQLSAPSDRLHDEASRQLALLRQSGY